MLQQTTRTQASPSKQLTVCLTTTPEEVREAQALRFRVFAEEMGARLPVNGDRLDIDLFDAHCDHLLVRDERSGEVVGTYRILPPARAKALGGYYSDTEFDLTRLQHIRERMVEVGRSCVHPEYRSGATIALLWAGLADYMRKGGYDYLVGCASISMADGGHMAASLFRQLRETSLAPVEWRVTPRCALPLAALDGHRAAELPPLIKGYLRAGAFVCGDPAWDPDFNTADLLILLPMQKLNQRYMRHFLSSK